MSGLRFIFTVAVLVLWLSPSPGYAQDGNGQRIKKIHEYITQAGSLYKNELYEEAGEKIKQAQTLMLRAFELGAESDREALESEYRRIAKAHELLKENGVELPEQIPFPETLGVPVKPEDEEPAVDEPAVDEPETPVDSDMDETSSDDSNEQVVSFKNQIVPIFVQHCGNCHVRGSKGKFNMGTFAKLLEGAEGKAMVPGQPGESRIVALIEDGKMPPRRRGDDSEFPEAELDLIKSWILQGGEFDGDDETAPIAGNSNTPPRRGR